MKKSMAIVLAMLMVLSLFAGCGKTEGTKTETKQEVSESKTEVKGETKAENPNEGKKTKITIGMTDNVTTLTPYLKINYYSDAVLCGMYEHLGQTEAYGKEFVGVLMKEWNEVDDVTYEIELYDYITDSAGNPFTANDVKFSLESLQAAGISQAKYAKSIEVIDDYNFVLTLSSPNVGYFEDLCQNCWMFTQAAMEASTDEMAASPVGTGPYKLVEYLSGSYIILEKRDDYWQKPELTPECSESNIDIIEFNILNETTQMSLALEKQTIQMGFWLNESIVPDAQALDNMVTESYPSSQMKAFIFNCSENSIFGGENGKLLRQAVCYAIDNQAIVASALNGIGTVPPTWGKTGVIGYNPEWENQEYYQFNIDKAKELLAEAGYPDGFKCVFGASDAKVNRDYMQVVQACCAAVGVEIEMQFFASNIQTQQRADLASGWDMFTVTSNGGNGYLMQYLGYYTDRNTQKHGAAMFGVVDDELQALTDAANAKTFTQEDIDKLHDYVVENAFVYQYYDAQFTCCHVPELEMYQNWRQDPQPGALKISDDWQWFAD